MIYSEEMFLISNISHHLECLGRGCRTIQAKFALTWFSNFRGEDLNANAYDVRGSHNGREVMAKGHMAYL